MAKDILNEQECMERTHAYALVKPFIDNSTAIFMVLTILGDALGIPDRTLLSQLAEYYREHRNDIGKQALENLSKQYLGE